MNDDVKALKALQYIDRNGTVVAKDATDGL